MRYVVLATVLSITPVLAHDIYHDVHGKKNQLCCGGDPVTGDCEGLMDDQIRVMSNGDALLFSKRYNRWILVAAETVEWTTIPADNGVHQGHFCGKPRTDIVMANQPPNAEQPDPMMWTYCAFISPGGV